MFRPSMEPSPSSSQVDALTAALVLRGVDASRNRNFALHASRIGAGARRRANRLRSMLRQITGAFGPAREVRVATEGDEVRLTFSLARVSLVREARLSAADLSILRVALAERGTRLLPAALLARDEDRARVATLLEEFASARNALAGPH
jgi:hypothetical protein